MNEGDIYIGFHATNTNLVHGRTVYIGAKAGDTATNSVETDLHFKTLLYMFKYQTDYYSGINYAWTIQSFPNGSNN